MGNASRLMKRFVHLVHQSVRGLSELCFLPICSACGKELPEWDSKPESRGRSILAKPDHDRLFKRLMFCGRCDDEHRPHYAVRCKQCGAGWSAGFDHDLQSLPPTVESVRLASGMRFDSSCCWCQRKNHLFNRCFSLGNYENALKKGVLRIKTEGSSEYAVAMGMMLGQWIEFLIRSEPQSKWDWVLPVPIYWWKRMSRRAVVSETLANQVADILQVSMHSNLLYCRRSTEKQGRLPLADRGRNVKGVFGLKGRHRLKGKNILIVDDVMTSGSTLDEATKVCLKAGAAEVSVAVLARGVGGSAPSR